MWILRFNYTITFVKHFSYFINKTIDELFAIWYNAVVSSMFLSNMKNNFRGNALKLFFYAFCYGGNMKKQRRKAIKHNKIFILCGQEIYEIFALFLMKGSAL